MKLLRVLVFCLPFSCLLLSCCKQTSPADIQFEQLDSLVWTNPDSAWGILDTLNYGAWQKTDQYHLQMLHEFCQLKTNRPLSPDSVMPPIVDYFKQTKNYKLLGEALYVQGAEYEWLSDFTKGTDCLKQAEQFLLKYEDNPLFLGMNYYKLGRCAEKEQLYHIAYQYYQQALPFFKSVNHHYYLANCYRELARTIPDRLNNQELMQHYFDSALIYAKQSGNLYRYYEIQLYNIQWQTTIDTMSLISISKYMADSLNAKSFNYNILAKYYLEHGDIAQGEYYLEQCLPFAQNNSTNLYICTYLQSLLFHAKHQNEEAFQTLKMLYDERNLLTELNGDANSAAIAKCYDVERERANTLQVTNSRLRIIIISLFVLLILAAVACWAFYKAKQNQILLQKSMAETQLTKFKLDAIRQQTADKDMFLRNLLMQRLQNIDMLKYQIDIHKAPEWAMPMIQKMLLTSKENRTLFMEEYNHLFSGFLSHIQEQYPLLTQEDILCLALFSLNLDSLQVATLIGYQKQSIWNRRNSIKTHLAESNGPVVDDLSAWITELRDEYLAQTNPQPVDAEQSASSEEDTTDITDSQTDTSV